MTSYPTSRVGLAAALVTSILGRQPVVAVPTAFIKLLPDCTAATFLAQCCFHSEQSTDPESWFEHSHEAWRVELDLSPEQVRRCVRDCAGMVEVRRMGLPARNFYRVRQEEIRARLATFRVPAEEEQRIGKTQKGRDDVGALPAPLPGDFPLSSHQTTQWADVRQPPPQAARQTPQHSSSFKKKEQEEKRTVVERVKDDVRPLPPVSTEMLTRLLSAWNANRGDLPEASGLSTSRRRAMTVLLADCEGDIEQASGLLTDAAKEVAGDKFWQDKKFSLDTLLPKVLGKAEAYRSRKTPKSSKAPDPFPDFGVGQIVSYRRERYAIESVTDRYIDLQDDENGSARIFYNSDDIRAVRPLEVRA